MRRAGWKGASYSWTGEVSNDREYIYV
jgi:hypothetical protein